MISISEHSKSAAKWSFNEFLAFLLIYASHADIDFCEAEKVLIKDTVTTKVFENIYDHFRQLTDFQALELILSYKDLYFSSKEEKDVLFKELHRLFNVDGDFSPLEKELILFLDRLM